MILWTVNYCLIGVKLEDPDRDLAEFSLASANSESSEVPSRFHELNLKTPKRPSRWYFSETKRMLFKLIIARNVGRYDLCYPES